MAVQLNTGSEDGMMAEINVTPLVDVMLVLLVIFIITAPLIVPQSQKVTLPKTEVMAPQEQSKAIVLVIDANGQLTTGDQVITDEALRARLKELAASEPKKPLQFQADEKVPYGRVAQLMALAQNSGISRLAFVTLPK